MSAPVNRRALLGSLARWTTPTVVTIALAARPLQAKASCPPCRRRVPPVTGTCRPCTVNQMLSCQCEPCLGAPYCASPSPVAPAPSMRAPAPGATGAQGFGTSPFVDPRREALRRIQLEQRQRQRALQGGNQLFPDPFGVERRAPGASSPSLYERLQQTPSRRQP